MPSLRKRYFQRMYRANPYRLGPYINTLGRINGRQNNGSLDIIPYPVEFNTTTMSKYPNTNITLTKQACVSKREMTEQCDVLSHARWIKAIADSDESFVQEVKTDVRAGCFERKILVNRSLVSACNFFLCRDNGFKRKGMKFLEGDDVFGIYYYSSNVQSPLAITKELTATFLVDLNDSVTLVFDTKPFPEFNERADERKRSLYALLKCKLVVTNEKEYREVAEPNFNFEDECGVSAE